ncbi:MAG TPA: alpha-L-arabinofuranosidase C-terminal domain-containing protein [Trebonia sp.]|nr:alpha-L-arabinofuranosidase C-terminal domain-containing protein [Trebonia sp.]
MSRIAIDPARAVGTIDRKLFGGFVEHLGHCIYGGLYEEGSPLSDERGFRTDVLGLLRELDLGVLRWPGGNFVSNYHWQDGIGPKGSRPRRPELAWGGEEPNTFGTDEFLAYCAELGTDPYICLNMGTGTLEEALAWVEYCNSARDTYWAARRRQNGRDRPYQVRYWALGNEMYGEWQVGQMSAEEYVREATRWARAIRMLDPGAKLVGCGEAGWTDWDRVVIDGLAGLVDYHSIHIYTGSDDYWTNVLQPHQAERAITTTAALIDRAAYSRGLASKPQIAYDEWNVWYRTMTVDLAERYDFSDALAVATYLNIFVRNCARVRMANLAQMVNAIAPIVATPDGAAVQPIYYPFLLHARAALDLAVDTHVAGETIAPDLPPDASRWPHRVADLGPFTLLDAAASVSADRRRLAVTIVNRSAGSEPARVVLRDLSFDGAAAITTVTAGGAGDVSALAGIATTGVATGEERPAGAEVALTLPPQSFTVIEAPLSAR